MNGPPLRRCCPISRAGSLGKRSSCSQWHSLGLAVCSALARSTKCFRTLLRPPLCGLSASAILWFRSPARPPGSFYGPEGVKSLFSFNRARGSCWRCKLVCRVKASIPAAIWQCRQRHCDTARTPTPPATTSRHSLHRSHGLAKALRSGIRPVESFLAGPYCSPQNFPQSIARPTADMLIWKTVNTY
jgi:hypothetical protein